MDFTHGDDAKDLRDSLLKRMSLIVMQSPEHPSSEDMEGYVNCFRTFLAPTGTIVVFCSFVYVTRWMGKLQAGKFQHQKVPMVIVSSATGNRKVLPTWGRPLVDGKCYFLTTR